MTDGVKSTGAGLRYPPFARPGVASRAPVTVAEGAADPPPDDDLPLIEQFLDELPSIDDYLAVDPPVVAEVSSAPVRAPEWSGPSSEVEGWAVSAWQSYDWSSLAALGRQSSERAEAESSWNATEWSDAGDEGRGVGYEGPLPGAQWSPLGEEPTAGEIAAALDAIARKIRSGELAIDQFRGIPPEAAMAAALAAMLRLRG